MFKIISTLLLILFYQNSLAQEAEEFIENDLPEVSVDDAPIKKLTVNKSPSATSAEATPIEDILLSKNIVSLMFTDDQSDNINRALDAFKSNQEFIPEQTAKEREENAGKLKEDEDREREKKVSENAKSFIYLASIVYFTPKDWAVWINDKKITYKDNDPEQEIFLVSVKPDSAQISWNLSVSKWRILSRQSADAVPPNLNENNQVEINFELHPNQTFSLNTSEISEGRALISLLKGVKRSETIPTD